MAIQLLKQPNRINPNSNDNVWEFKSTEPNFVYFNIQLINIENSLTIVSQKYYSKPNNGTVSVDLSRPLSGMAESILTNSDDLVTMSRIPSYMMVVREYIMRNGVPFIVGQLVFETPHYYFEARENKLSFLTYTSDTYNINTKAKAKFLTYEKAVKTISTSQKEYLKIFNVDGVGKKLLVKLYDGDGDFLVDLKIDLPVVADTNVINLNVTPSVILNHPQVKAVEDSVFAQQYRVCILDGADKEVSEARLFKLESTPCYLQETNIVFKNSLGGFDSILFHNRVETLTINKTYYTKDDTYSSLIFRSNKESLLIDVRTNYTATSNLLDDFDAKYVKELLATNRAYVVIGKYLVEITIDNKTYRVLQRLTNGLKRSRLEVQFNTPFSIEQLDDILKADDVDLNNNPDPALYLADNKGAFIIDNWFSNITLKY